MHTSAPPRFEDAVLRDGDLLLDALTVLDAPRIAEACNDPQTQRWLPLPTPYSHDDALFYVNQMAHHSLDSGDGIERAIRLDGDFVGVIGLKETSRAAAKTEAGYWLAPWGRGQGVMTRALRLLTDWALDTQGIGRVEAHVAPENGASLGVARRAGFIEEGLMRRAGFTHAGPTDLVLFSRLADDPRP
ncbi:RimJ/RimL family protein N-acetyltransferase [Luteococcus japonicus]|uniref:RimJ/RimL family protein N-acetyltransferase n=1 Tax=Luteococcus japonicus TaxID=33984 RepID=A0A3N1ZW60_9ACTN|nr:GNAT family protein [Luteococcus japonicus]ROR55091.1 RimJ/RimL family protein N-acetyltransferase [Luteococcus japonicus]